MSVRELEVLLYLIKHQGRVVSVEELRDVLWAGERLAPQSNAVAVCVLRLRARLEGGGALSTIIRTVRGRGYRFYPPGGVPGERPGTSGTRSSTGSASPADDLAVDPRELPET